MPRPGRPLDLRSPEMRAADEAAAEEERRTGRPRFRHFRGPEFAPHTGPDDARSWLVAAGNAFWDTSLLKAPGTRRYHFRTPQAGERALAFLSALKRGDSWTDEDVYEAAVDG